MAGMKFGLNLFSLRDQISTKEDFLKTATKLKEAGNSFFQYSGATWDPKRIKKMVDEVGTPVYLTHIPQDRLLNETEKVIEEKVINYYILEFLNYTIKLNIQ